MVIGLKTKLAVIAALSAITGLIIAASYFRRRKPRVKRKEGRPPRPTEFLKHNGHVVHSVHGKLILSPLSGTPKSPSRLSRASSRRSRSLQSHSRASSLASSGISGSVQNVNVTSPSLEGASHDDQAPVFSSHVNGIQGGEKTPTNEQSNIQRLFQIGMDSFDIAVEYWENAIDTPLDPSKDPSDTVLIQKLDRLLTKAYAIQDEYEEAAHSIIPMIDSHELAKQLQDLNIRVGRRSSDGGSSSDSFVSASELEDSVVENCQRGFAFYDNALQIVRNGGVQVRRNRTKMLKCCSEEDFLAKVHCIREAMAILLSDVTTLQWMVDAGKQMVANLLLQGNYDTEQFSDTFDDMMRYIQEADNWKEIREELEGRNVKCMSFYDIVLDFFILDSFDDLSDPPSSVTCITQNRWLSNSVKETALSTAIWSVLSAKRTMLKKQNGFMSHFYALTSHISPALAWGFLGSDENLTEVMLFFKEQVSRFCCDIFSLDKCRYSSVHELSDDILSWFKTYSIVVAEKLDSAL